MPRRYLDQRLKLPLLRIADALEVHGSLMKAAASLGVGQPALTRSLRELEEIAGCLLFERHARGVRPTEAGIVLIRLARRVLAEMHRAEEELDALGATGGGTLALGVLPVAAAGVLPGVLIRLRAEHPGVTVRLQQGRTEELLPLLAAREIDMVLGRLYPPAIPDSFVREALWEEPISILVRSGHPLLRGRQKVTPESLARHDVVLPTVSQRVGQEIEQVLALLGLRAAAPLRSSSYGFIREMLLATDHIAVMPRLMMVGDLLRGTLAVVPLPIELPPRAAGFIVPGDRPQSPAACAFLACLRAHLSEIAERGLASITAPDGSQHRSDGTRRGRRT